MPDLRGPSYMNHDFGLFKNFMFNDTRKFQFRASFTNVFNHPQRFMDDNANLKLDFHERRDDQRRFRRASAEPEVRPAYHSARVQVLSSDRDPRFAARFSSRARPDGAVSAIMGGVMLTAVVAPAGAGRGNADRRTACAGAGPVLRQRGRAAAVREIRRRRRGISPVPRRASRPTSRPDRISASC